MRSTVGGVVSLAAGAFVMTVLVSSCSGSSSDPQTSASGSAATGEPGLLVSESNGAQNNEILVYQLGGDARWLQVSACPPAKRAPATICIRRTRSRR